VNPASVPIIGQTNRPEPKRPRSGAWVRTGTHTYKGGTAEIYDHPSGMRVLSSVDWVSGADGKGLEFHISISAMGGRANRDQVRQALADFGMRKGIEDNHVPNGKARNFWLPVDPALKAGCHCFETEEPHDEGDGYIWREAPEDER